MEIGESVYVEDKFFSEIRSDLSLILAVADVSGHP